MAIQPNALQGMVIFPLAGSVKEAGQVMAAMKKKKTGDKKSNQTNPWWKATFNNIFIFPR